MKSHLFRTLFASTIIFAASAEATPISIDISATLQDVTGTCLGSLSTGQSLDGSFAYDVSVSATSFSSSGVPPVGVIVNNDLSLVARDAHGLVPDGIKVSLSLTGFNPVIF